MQTDFMAAASNILQAHADIVGNSFGQGIGPLLKMLNSSSSAQQLKGASTLSQVIVEVALSFKGSMKPIYSHLVTHGKVLMYRLMDLATLSVPPKSTAVAYEALRVLSALPDGEELQKHAAARVGCLQQLCCLALQAARKVEKDLNAYRNDPSPRMQQSTAHNVTITFNGGATSAVATALYPQPLQQLVDRVELTCLALSNLLFAVEPEPLQVLCPLLKSLITDAVLPLADARVMAVGLRLAAAALRCGFVTGVEASEWDLLPAAQRLGLLAAKPAQEELVIVSCLQYLTEHLYSLGLEGTLPAPPTYTGGEVRAAGQGAKAGSGGGGGKKKKKGKGHGSSRGEAQTAASSSASPATTPASAQPVAAFQASNYNTSDTAALAAALAASDGKQDLRIAAHKANKKLRELLSSTTLGADIAGLLEAHAAVPLSEMHPAHQSVLSCIPALQPVLRRRLAPLVVSDIGQGLLHALIELMLVSMHEISLAAVGVIANGEEVPMLPALVECGMVDALAHLLLGVAAGRSDTLQQVVFLLFIYVRFPSFKAEVHAQHIRLHAGKLPWVTDSEGPTLQSFLESAKGAAEATSASAEAAPAETTQAREAKDAATSDTATSSSSAEPSPHAASSVVAAAGQELPAAGRGTSTIDVCSRPAGSGSPPRQAASSSSKKRVAEQSLELVDMQARAEASPVEAGPAPNPNTSISIQLSLRPDAASDSSNSAGNASAGGKPLRPADLPIPSQSLLTILYSMAMPDTDWNARVAQVLMGDPVLSRGRLRDYVLTPLGVPLPPADPAAHAASAAYSARMAQGGTPAEAVVAAAEAGAAVTAAARAAAAAMSGSSGGVQGQYAAAAASTGTAVAGSQPTWKGAVSSSSGAAGPAEAEAPQQPPSSSSSSSVVGSVAVVQVVGAASSQPATALSARQQKKVKAKRRAAAAAAAAGEQSTPTAGMQLQLQSLSPAAQALVVAFVLPPTILSDGSEVDVEDAAGGTFDAADADACAGPPPLVDEGPDEKVLMLLQQAAVQVVGVGQLAVACARQDDADEALGVEAEDVSSGMTAQGQAEICSTETSQSLPAAAGGAPSSSACATEAAAAEVPAAMPPAAAAAAPGAPGACRSEPAVAAAAGAVPEDPVLASLRSALANTPGIDAAHMERIIASMRAAMRTAPPPQHTAPGPAAAPSSTPAAEAAVAAAAAGGVAQSSSSSRPSTPAAGSSGGGVTASSLTAEAMVAASAAPKVAPRAPSHNDDDASISTPPAQAGPHACMHGSGGSEAGTSTAARAEAGSLMAPAGDDDGDGAAAPAPAVPGPRVCAACGAAATPGTKLKRCAGCVAVRYCSAHCQRLHWKQHRRECAGAGTAAAAAGAGAGAAVVAAARTQAQAVAEAQEATIAVAAAAVQGS